MHRRLSKAQPPARPFSSGKLHLKTCNSHHISCSSQLRNPEWQGAQDAVGSSISSWRVPFRYIAPEDLQSQHTRFLFSYAFLSDRMQDPVESSTSRSPIPFRHTAPEDLQSQHTPLLVSYAILSGTMHRMLSRAQPRARPFPSDEQQPKICNSHHTPC